MPELTWEQLNESLVPGAQVVVIRSRITHVLEMATVREIGSVQQLHSQSPPWRPVLVSYKPDSCPLAMFEKSATTDMTHILVHAILKSAAMRLRARGHGRDALGLEQRCETIYGHMPAYAKW